MEAELDPYGCGCYDAQLRAWIPNDCRQERRWSRTGQCARLSGVDGRGFVTYISVSDLDPAELDALIARQRDVYAVQGQAVEWKLHGHDQPADLADRLRAAGFEPEEQETVLVGLAEPLADADPPLPIGIRLREVTERADLDRIATMETAVWDADRSFLAAAPGAGTRRGSRGHRLWWSPRPIPVRSCARDGFGMSGVRPSEPCGAGPPCRRGEGEASTRPWSAIRAHLAARRGHNLLQVDASDDSRPILQRAGFVAVTTTTPYVFTPLPA